MAGTWSIEETKALIAIWGQKYVKSQLDRVIEIATYVYELIAMELRYTYNYITISIQVRC